MKAKCRILAMVTLVTIIISGLFIFGGCASKEPVQKSQFMLNTNCTLTVYGRNANKIIDEAFQKGVDYENLLSTAIETSDVYRINHAEGKPVEVSSDTVKILEEGKKYSEASGGLFDLTTGALTSLWDFPGGKAIVPTPEQIDAAKKTVGYKDVKIEGNTVTLLRPGAQLDFGAIAKGYIADRLSDFMKEKGVDGAIINLGGNVITVGEKPTKAPWNVGIQQPFAERDQSIGAVQVGPKSVVTSGIYERSFTSNGKFYHHILDPTTGYPAENNLSAVSIISDLSVDGDGLSTTCFLLGEDKAMELIESIDNVEAIFIEKDGKIRTSSGIGTDIPFELAQ
jgi:thiamine biosynthesis lipoprotein